MDRFSLPENFPSIRLVQPVKNIHERCLAGTVFPKECMDLTFFHNH